jgi:heme exporter protein A
MITIKGLTKVYGMRPVLRSLDLDVERGEFVALIGANGAGKTTLLRVLATLLKPDNGKVTINFFDVVREVNKVQHLIGYVSHQPLVYADLSAFENLQFTARMYNLFAGASNNRHTLVNTKITDALKQAGLMPRAHDRVKTYSRGMLQRLAIARATLHDPLVMLLDEPYTGLDHKAAMQLNALLHESLALGRTIIMSTHEMSRGLYGVTRVVMLQAGRIEKEVTGQINEERLVAESLL